MRISVDKHDPAYDYGYAEQVDYVTLDDVRLDDCITADDQKGEVLRYVAEGLLDTEWFFGKVQIFLKSE